MQAHHLGTRTLRRNSFNAVIATLMETEPGLKGTDADADSLLVKTRELESIVIAQWAWCVLPSEEQWQRGAKSPRRGLPKEAEGVCP